MSRRYDSPAIDPVWRKAREAARRLYRGYAAIAHDHTRALRKARRCRNERAVFQMMLHDLREFHSSSEVTK
jgi:hypothetical protein